MEGAGEVSAHQIPERRDARGRGRDLPGGPQIAAAGLQAEGVVCYHLLFRNSTLEPGGGWTSKDGANTGRPVTRLF